MLLITQLIQFQSSARSMSQLPALTAPSGTDSGPLRVTVHYHNNPALGSITGGNRTTPSGLRRYTRSYTDHDISSVPTTPTVGAEEGRTIRRVRFELPPKSPPPSILHSGATSGKSTQQKQVAGVESWLRSRAGISSFFSSTLTHDRQLNHGAGSGQLVTAASRAVVTTTAVSAQRIHDTERYRRGTLSPGAAGPGTDCSPEAATLLKAARDGDETALCFILRQAERTGLPAEDLNCQDSSGRVSTDNVYTCTYVCHRTSRFKRTHGAGGSSRILRRRVF